MTKKTALNIFKENLNQMSNKKDILKDIPMISEMWGNWTDILCKDGEITETKYNTWSNPYQMRSN